MHGVDYSKWDQIQCDSDSGSDEECLRMCKELEENRLLLSSSRSDHLDPDILLRRRQEQLAAELQVLFSSPFPSKSEFKEWADKGGWLDSQNCGFVQCISSALAAWVNHRESTRESWQGIVLKGWTTTFGDVLSGLKPVMVIDAVARAAVERNLAQDDLRTWVDVTRQVLGAPECIHEYLETDVTNETCNMRGFTSITHDSETGCVRRSAAGKHVQLRLVAQRRLREALTIQLQSGQTWGSLKARADHEYAQGNYGEARKIYSLSIDVAPNDALRVLRSNRAQCSLKLKDFSDCIEDCTSALGQVQDFSSPLITKLLCRRITAALGIKNYALAVSDIDKLESPQLKRSLETQLYCDVFGPNDCKHCRSFVSEQHSRGANSVRHCRDTKHSSLAYLDGKFYMFGGLQLKETTLASPDLLSYDIASKNWSVEEAFGDIQPTPRYGHILEQLDSSQLVLWGGTCKCCQFVEDPCTYTWKPSCGSWQVVDARGICPPRCFASSAHMASCVFVFGGRWSSQHGLCLRSDLWVLDMEALTWSEIQIRPGLQPIEKAAMVVVSNSLWIFGGTIWHDEKASKASSTSCLYRVELDRVLAGQSRRIRLRGDIPAAMSGHAMSLISLCVTPGMTGHQNFLLVFGGIMEFGPEFQNEMLGSEISDIEEELQPKFLGGERTISPFRNAIYLFHVTTEVWARWRPLRDHRMLLQLAEAIVVQDGPDRVLIGGGYGLVKSLLDRTGSNSNKYEKGLRRGRAEVPMSNGHVFKVELSSFSAIAPILKHGMCQHGECPIVWSSPKTQLCMAPEGGFMVMYDLWNTHVGVPIWTKDIHPRPEIFVMADKSVGTDLVPDVMEILYTKMDSAGYTVDTFYGPVQKDWADRWKHFLLIPPALNMPDKRHAGLPIPKDNASRPYWSLCENRGYCGTDYGRKKQIAMDAFLAQQHDAGLKHTWLVKELNTMSDSEWFEIRIVLIDLIPEVWRKVVVPGKATLSQIHDQIICSVMPWQRNYHAHCFHATGKRISQLVGVENVKVGECATNVYFGPVDSTAIDMCWAPFCYGPFLDDRKVKLQDLLRKKGDTIDYVYDLGNQWRHRIVRDDQVDDSSANIDLLDGFGACPPEDCDGIRTYLENLMFLRPPRKMMFEHYTGCSVKDPIKPDEAWWQAYSHVRGRPNTDLYFDPCFFDIEAAQRRLQSALRSPHSVDSEARNQFANNALKEGFRGPTVQDGTAVPSKICAVCGVTVGLQKCNHCRLVWYCSRKHQKQHWKTHKNVCRCCSTEDSIPGAGH